MLFGHNSDVKVGDTVYHVQTEDRGVDTGLVDTTVYCGGRVLHRRAKNYLDLLPLTEQHAGLLRKRIDDQHRGVIEELRSGALHLPPPQAKAKPIAVTAPANAVSAAAGKAPVALNLQLLNPKTWLAGKRANLQIVVREKQNGSAVAGAKVVARVEGAVSGGEFTAQTEADGGARLEFDMPPFSGGEPALVIEATSGGATAQLKFHLRARTKVPSA